MNPALPRRSADGSRGAASPRSRRGSVLIVVLVVIVLLTYAVYGFTERMLAEAEAAEAHGRAAQATAFAESGVELAASLVASRAADPENPVSLYHDPTLMSGVIMKQSPTPAAVGRFSLVAPVEADATGRQIRFGLADEAGKLNLNAVAKLKLEEFDQQTMLIYLPGMTDEIADAILDYVDEDEQQRTLGAEAEYYEGLSPPTVARNGPLESIDELLLVRGVTPELLYGEDANRNGLLDPAEDDGPATPPLDDADGVLNPGWVAFLTVRSRELNAARPDGTKKIHINQGLLTDLFDAVEEELDTDAARFVAAYRMYGPNDGDTGEESGEQQEGGESGGSESGTGGGSGGQTGGESGQGGGGGGGGGGSTPPSQSQMQAANEAAGNLSKLLTSAQEGDSVTRAGLDLSKGAQFEVKSLYELIDREVDIPADEEKGIEAETIVSPWSSGDITGSMALLLDVFAQTETAYLEVRVNVNEARREVLLGLPNMTPQIVDAIIAARASGSGPVALGSERLTTGWLVARGIVDLPTMRKLDTYLSARGDVFKVQAIGFFDGGGPVARVEAVVDGTVTPAKIVSFRDLSDLGRGYAPSQLLPGGGSTAP